MAASITWFRTTFADRVRELRTAVAILRSGPFDTATAQGRAEERYRRILLTTISNLASRATGAIVSLAVTPLVLSYLGKEQFGLWAAITSMITWVSLFDFGVINGLVNAISEANGREDRVAAGEYVSTAFALLIAVAALLGALSVGLLGLVRWDSLLGAQGRVPPDIVASSVAAALAVVIAGFPLSIVHQVYVGYQKAYVSSIFDLLGQPFMLGAAVATIAHHGTLPVLVLAFGGASLGAALLNLAWLLGREMPWLRPSPYKLSRRALHRLLKTSTPLFLFQVGALLINQTQSPVLARVASLDVVAEYSVLWRLYLLAMSVIMVSTTSFSPPIREAVERGDTAWARRHLGHFLRVRMTLAAGACVGFLVLGNFVLRIWLRREDIQFSWVVWVALCATCLTAVWVQTFADVLIVLDEIWGQLWLVLINGIVTVALTGVLGRPLGVLGAVIGLGATCTFLGSWAYPRLARRALEARIAGAQAEAART